MVSCQHEYGSFLNVLFSSGHCEATADFLQGRGKPCATQRVPVLPGCWHWHGTHPSLWPLPKVWRRCGCWYHKSQCLFINDSSNPSTFFSNNASVTVRFYRDAKAHCSAKNLVDQIAGLGALKSAKCNASGSQVSILISQVRQALSQSPNMDFLKLTVKFANFMLIFRILKTFLSG